MRHIEIEPTYKSPRVNLDPTVGKMLIEGKSILVNVEDFYRPLLNWMDEFIANPPTDSIEFTFDIEYFNLASTKRFMFFLIKLKELNESGCKVLVNWAFSSNDKYVKEMGEDLSQLLRLDFNFVEYEKLKERSYIPN